MVVMVDDNKSYTLPELARKAEISESSARRYAKDFAEYMLTVDGGRFRRYKAESVQALQFIKKLYDAGHDKYYIRKSLSYEFSMAVETVHQYPPQAIEDPEKYTLKELMTELTRSLQHAQPGQKSLQPDDLQYILARLDHIEQRLDRLEKRGWIKKFFK
ncbi:MAG: helix-turn-helix domain-containing protein [Desulfovibrionales bacterium]|nr:helix-turn-helix domain-containing protein [Desulfovibrionales bacterium]